VLERNKSRYRERRREKIRRDRIKKIGEIKYEKKERRKEE
jgi:hypothetical protein